MFQVKNLSCKLGSHEILRGINFSLKRGQVGVVLGGSGAGKTTLLRCLCGLIPIKSGTFLVDNVVRKIGDHDLGLVPQGFSLFENMTVLQNLTYGLRRVKKLSNEEANSIGLRWLRKFSLENHRNSYPSKISGGQKQRVAIARALALQPKALLFDEPTSALDPEMTFEVVKLIRKVASSGMIVLIVTHDLSMARAVANRIFFLDKGKILEDLTTEQFFHAPKTTRVRSFLKNYFPPETKSVPKNSQKS